jgi:serine/threonine protein kinase
MKRSMPDCSHEEPEYPSKKISNSLHIGNIAEGSYGVVYKPRNKLLFMKRKNPDFVDEDPEYHSKKVLKGLHKYEKLGKIGEGTYGVVYKARNKNTNILVALKKIRHTSEKEGFPLTSIREFNLLKSTNHKNIVKLLEVVVSETTQKCYLVFDYYEHDLAGLLDRMKRPFSHSEIKCILMQLFDAIKYSHENYIIHRDIKLSNLLMNNKGRIVLADWGLARRFAHPLETYTPHVVTLWYRSPELLFGSLKYHTGVDMWALGCIFGELLKHKPLLPGKTPLEQITLIMQLLGAPNDRIWPGFSRLPLANGFKEIDRSQYQYNDLSHERFPDCTLTCLGLLKGLLAYDPAKRITASEALKHPFFSEQPFPKQPELMPTFPARQK